ncbi:ribosomal protein S5 domain 2-type protein [Entophlyctis helioformis]|nr:ribosomal protein S5 domain 2-type protein [Entophlyctis helioformis]
MSSGVGASERDYITKGVEAGIRADGRSPLDCRKVVLETGMITQASGSCRVAIDDGTDVLAGVKVQVGDVEGRVESDRVAGEDMLLDAGAAGADTAVDGGDVLDDGVAGAGSRANVGRVVCSVECSPSAMPFADPRDVEQMCNDYSQILNRILNGPHGGLDLGKLCIIPGATCWIVSVDVLILDYGGNVLDTIAMAVRGALHNTRLPKATVEQTDGHYEFDIADDETETLSGRDMVPVAQTLCKIGSGRIVDATPLEDLCSSARLTVFVNRAGHVCGLQKSGKGSLEPSILVDMIETGVKTGAKTLAAMDKMLEREEHDRLRDIEPLGFR